MRVVYNDVDMGVTELIAFDGQAVYDDSGTDYLYTKFEIVIRALVNGYVRVSGNYHNGPFLSYRFGDQVNVLNQGEGFRPRPEVPVSPQSYGTPPDGAGIIEASRPRIREVIRTPETPAPLTHNAVRHRLETPRGKLFVFGSAPVDQTTSPKTRVTMLESPNPDMPCDCKNGPTPKVLAVHTALGDATTLMVDWACETYVNESSVNGVGLAGSLLSNRFAQTQVIDDAGYTTVITAGVAVFRTDFLYKYLESPDHRRQLLFLPIPNGFVRENIQVRGREDVTGVEYSFRDVQVPVNFPAGPFARAAKIVAVHRQAIVNSFDVFEGATSIYERVLGLKANKYFADQDRHEGDKSDAGSRGGRRPRKPSIMGRPNAPFHLPINPGMQPPQAPPGGGRP